MCILLKIVTYHHHLLSLPLPYEWESTVTGFGELGDDVRVSRKVSIGSERLSFVIGIFTVLKMSSEANSISIEVAL